MHKTLTYALIFSTILLAGCDQSQDNLQNFSAKQMLPPTITEPINTAVQEVAQNVDTELLSMVEKLKLEDPTIVDAYYSQDENGEKVLNVVKEDSNPTEGSSGLSTFMWAMAGGLTANMLFNSMSSNKGNMNSVTNQFKPIKRYSSSYDSYNQDKMTSTHKSSLNKSINTSTFNSNKFTPVDTTKQVAPLSKDAYRNTNVTQEPKTLTKTVKTKKKSYLRKSFGRSLFKRR
jgi:hypothetical protein